MRARGRMSWCVYALCSSARICRRATVGKTDVREHAWHHPDSFVYTKDSLYSLSLVYKDYITWRTAFQQLSCFVNSKMRVYLLWKRSRALKEVLSYSTARSLQMEGNETQRTKKNLPNADWENESCIKKKKLVFVVLKGKVAKSVRERGHDSVAVSSHLSSDAEQLLFPLAVISAFFFFLFAEGDLVARFNSHNNTNANQQRNKTKKLKL